MMATTVKVVFFMESSEKRAGKCNGSAALSIGPQLAQIFHRTDTAKGDGIALVCSKIEVSNLDQRAGNAETKLYRRN
jgi:hypothetical protein